MIQHPDMHVVPLVPVVIIFLPTLFYSRILFFAFKTYLFYIVL